MRNAAANVLVCGFDGDPGFERAQIIDTLSGAQKLDRKNPLEIRNDWPELKSGAHGHRHVIFLVA